MHVRARGNRESGPVGVAPSKLSMVSEPERRRAVQLNGIGRLTKDGPHSPTRFGRFRLKFKLESLSCSFEMKDNPVNGYDSINHDDYIKT